MVVFDDALALDQEDAECHHEGRVRDSIPGEGEAQDVNQNAEHYDAEVVQDLGDCAAQDPALYLLAVLPGGVDSGPEVDEAGQDHKNATNEDKGDAVADVLGEGEV